MAISPLGRQDLNALPKALQVWLAEVQRRLSEQPIVAALSMDVVASTLPDAPAAAVAYSQADMQAVVDLLNDVRDKQSEIISLLGSIVGALGQPIGS